VRPDAMPFVPNLRRPAFPPHFNAAAFHWNQAELQRKHAELFLRDKPGAWEARRDENVVRSGVFQAPRVGWVALGAA